jgi:hypothetical protein
MMNQSTLYQDIARKAYDISFLDEDRFSKYAPAEIRETISNLVAEHKYALADAVASSGLAMHPDSEDILAISSLLSMLRENWQESAEHLEHLIEVMLIKALRCAVEPARALSAVIRAHEHYPRHPDLEREFEQLSSQLGLLQEERQEVASPAGK